MWLNYTPPGLGAFILVTAVELDYLMFVISGKSIKRCQSLLKFEVFLCMRTLLFDLLKSDFFGMMRGFSVGIAGFSSLETDKLDEARPKRMSRTFYYSCCFLLVGFSLFSGYWSGMNSSTGKLVGFKACRLYIARLGCSRCCMLSAILSISSYVSKLGVVFVWSIEPPIAAKTGKCVSLDVRSTPWFLFDTYSEAMLFFFALRGTKRQK